MPFRQKLLAVSALLICSSAALASTFSARDEYQRLASVLRQLDATDQLSTPRESILVDPSARYAFDYARLSADLDLIRQGIKGYLTPTRAQPRNPPKLTGHYTRSIQDQP